MVGPELINDVLANDWDFLTAKVYKQPKSHGQYPQNELLYAKPSELANLIERYEKRGFVLAIGALCRGGELQRVDEAMGQAESTQDLEEVITMLEPYFTYQWPLFMEAEKIESKAVVATQELDYGFMGLVDFDCVPIESNLKRIVTKLEEFGDNPWKLFDSGGSYHLYFYEGGYSGSQVIQLYGRLIGTFADELGFKSHIFKSFAEDLVYGAELVDIYGGEVMMRDVQKIKKACKDMLGFVGHYDEGDSSKLHFIIDLRYLAYAVKEILDFEAGNDLSFPALRITKGKYMRPPLLVAESRDHRVKLINNDNSDFEMMNPRLQGL